MSLSKPISNSAMMTDHEYVVAGGSLCPHCRSENIAGGSFEADSQTATREVHCDDCDKDWFESFLMQGWIAA